MYKIPPPDLQIDFSTALAEIRNSTFRTRLAKRSRLSISRKSTSSLPPRFPSPALQHWQRTIFAANCCFRFPYFLKPTPGFWAITAFCMASARKSFTPLKPAFPGFRTWRRKATLPQQPKPRFLPCAKRDPGRGILTGRDRRKAPQPGIAGRSHLVNLGPQLRGGANVKRGAAEIVKVFGAIHDIVRKAAINAVATRIEIKNAAGRTA